MDVLQITVLATIGLGILAPADWYVAFRFWQAWHGRDTIRYFAPTIFVIVALAVAVTACFFVALSAIQLRLTGFGIVPPGVGLLIVLAALLLPSLGLVWLLRQLRRRP